MIQGRKAKARETYAVEWRKERLNNGAHVSGEDHYGYRINRISPCNGAVEVHNLEVAEDNSYCTVSGLVHNCAIFPKGARDDLVDATSMGLRYLRDAGFALRSEEAAAEEKRNLMYHSPSDTRPLYGI